MPKYRKRPVIIEAVEWTGKPGTISHLLSWIGPSAEYNHYNNVLIIHTLEGMMAANLGDFIIQGVQGEFYPCKPDIFHATYEAVDDE